MPLKPMMMWRGFLRGTPITAKNVVRITPEIIQCDCPECGGDGDWGKFLADNPELCADVTGAYPYVPGSYACTDCKGTGRIFA